MKKVKIFFSTALPAFVAFLSLYIWKALYIDTPMAFSAVGVRETPLEHYYYMGSFCHNLPVCFRPFTSWLIIGFEKIIVVPIQFVLSITYPNVVFVDVLVPITAASISATVILGLCYMASFYFLWKTFPGVYGFLAWISFLSIPIVFNVVGLNQYDPVVLCFWTIVLFSSMELLHRSFDEPIVGWKKYKETLLINFRDWRSLSLSAFMVGFMSSFIIENTGAAFCIGSLFLFTTGKIFGCKFPTFGFVFSSGLGVLFAMGISWVLTHRHDDVYWGAPGHGVDLVWRIYGSRNTFLSIAKHVVEMMGPGIKIGAMLFALSLLFGNLLGKVDLRRMKITFLTACSYLIGFCFTLIAARYTTGFEDEFTRQLLPVAYFASYIFPALGLLAGFWVRKLIVPIKMILPGKIVS